MVPLKSSCEIVSSLVIEICHGPECCLWDFRIKTVEDLWPIVPQALARYSTPSLLARKITHDANQQSKICTRSLHFHTMRKSIVRVWTSRCKRTNEYLQTTTSSHKRPVRKDTMTKDKCQSRYVHLLNNTWIRLLTREIFQRSTDQKHQHLINNGVM